MDSLETVGPVEMGLLIFYWYGGGWFFAGLEAWTKALENTGEDHRYHMLGAAAAHRYTPRTLN